MTRRVWITGAGVVTGNAASVTELALRLEQRQSAIAALHHTAQPRWPIQYGAEIAPEALERTLGSKQATLSRDQQIALCSVQEALVTARLPEDAPERRAVAVVVGCVQYHGRSAIAALIGDRFGLGRQHVVVDAACSSGAHAIAVGHTLIQAGAADLVLATSFNSLVEKDVAGLYQARVLARSGLMRPFDRHRKGTFVGEASASLILESEASARRRDVPPIAELRGHGTGSDAFDIIPPERSGRGMRTSIEAALRLARLRPHEIDYVNAHGTGTKLNDPCETAALLGALGKAAYSIPVSSTKPITGHTLGAAGGVEAIIALISVARGFIPATVNHTEADPACPLDYVPQMNRRRPVRCALSTSAGFGGVYCSLLFSNPELAA